MPLFYDRTVEIESNYPDPILETYFLDVNVDAPGVDSLLYRVGGNEMPAKLVALNVRDTMTGLAPGRHTVEVVTFSGGTPQVQQEMLTVFVDQVDFIVFPNPANDAATVRIPSEYQGKDVTVSLYDFYGRGLLTLKVRGTTTFDVSQLPPGTYVVRAVSMNDGQEIGQKKLIIRELNRP